MKKICFFFIFISMMFISCPCSEPIIKESTITGNVYFSDSSIPIEGVTIQVGDSFSTTDSDGYYSVIVVYEEQFTLSATRSDFESHSNTFYTPLPEIEYDIYLSTSILTGTLSGTVVDENSDPLQGVEISIENFFSTDITDSTGHYQLSSVPQGNRVVKADKLGFFFQEPDIYLSSQSKDYNFTLIHDNELCGTYDPLIDQDQVIIEKNQYNSGIWELSGYFGRRVGELIIEEGVYIIGKDSDLSKQGLTTYLILDGTIDNPIILENITLRRGSYDEQDPLNKIEGTFVELLNCELSTEPWPQFSLYFEYSKFINTDIINLWNGIIDLNYCTFELGSDITVYGTDCSLSNSIIDYGNRTFYLGGSGSYVFNNNFYNANFSGNYTISTFYRENCTISDPGPSFQNEFFTPISGIGCGW